MELLEKVAGVKFVIGFPKDGGSSSVQSVIFDKDKWDEADAKEWLKEHELKGSKVDETKNTYRFRQQDPAKFRRFRITTPKNRKQGKTHKELEESDFTVDGEVVKVDEDKRLVFGWASMSSVKGKAVKDRQQDLISEDEMEEMAYKFAKDVRVGGEMHERDGKRPKQIGDLVETIAFTTEKQKALGIDLKKVGWWLGFLVGDDDTWKSVKDGTFKGFSIHGRSRRLPLTNE